MRCQWPSVTTVTSCWQWAATVGLLPDARFGASLHFVGQPSPRGIGRSGPNTQVDADGKEQNAQVVDLAPSEQATGADGAVQGEMGVTLVQSQPG